MDEINIDDKRSASDFRGSTFSKFKKTDVKKELLNSINNGKIENACNWSAELICSGHFSDLWEIILFCIGKHIHLGNPKLPIYINLRFQSFKEIVQNGYIGSELLMRNNDQIRNLFAEVISILCVSNKKPAFEIITIKPDEFNMTTLSGKLKASNVQYAKSVFRENDPNEIYICINELAFQLGNTSKNILKSCYWIEWLIEFDAICRKKKQILAGEMRTFPKINQKYQNDVIWIVWELLLHMVKDNPVAEKIMNALLDLFSIKYTYAIKKKRRYLLYFAVELVTENIPTKIEILDAKEKPIVNNVVQKINMIYKNIKKNEEKSNSGYLLENLPTEKRTNAEKTIEKLGKMDAMVGAMTPRI